MPEVRLPTILRDQAGGRKAVQADGSTVGELLNDLVRQYPAMSSHLLDDDGALRKFVNVYLEDEDVRYLQKLDTIVPEDGVLSILPAVAGGAKR